MDKRQIAFLLLITLLLPLFSGCLEEETLPNENPVITISYPSDNARVSGLVMISGSASDPDGDNTLQSIEIKINNRSWEQATGTVKWSFDWETYEFSDDFYTISVRAFDGVDYSQEKTITLIVENPKIVDSDAHKWAVFIAAANFPADNESKLGNGGLYLAEEMTAYFIQEYNYATSNIIILFDDGWIREDNGYGQRIMTLQQRRHEYDITYGGATREIVENSLNRVITESNKYRDSEVFIWFFNHGYGDANDSLTGGKLLESSQIFFWDDIISDRELGDLLNPLKSKKTCVIVDACYCGGFAEKTIYNLPTSLLFRSGIPRSGRIVIAGSSKFRKGYASTTQGPLFTLLWFEGLKTGKADGYKPGLLKTGQPRNLRIYKNGKVSVEEAFYYARYVLRTDEGLKDFKTMEPQINDNYPLRRFFMSRREMHLGEN
jgi:hypothetical protein